jgi:hypothetical protein
MARQAGTRRIQATALLRTGWAVTLLLVPERLLRIGGQAPPPAAISVVRVLGIRHLLQAAVSAVAPVASVAALGAVVDTVHTGTCAALAVVSPRWRRAALIDAAVESGFAASGWNDSPASRSRRGEPA